MFEEAHADEHIDDGMVLLQANLDDMNPEWTSYVSDLLFAEGANDVYWVPIIMKRGRPGVMLNVLTDERAVERLEEIVFRETTTLGVRRLRASVHRLGRRIVHTETQWGTIPVKVGLFQGKEVQYAPEYRECAAAAERYGVPLKQVYDEVRRLYLESKGEAR
ncbi:nickel pincer cofactor biosynthesis protein LarC2 [Paenibacillus alkalitolerans]|uniref:nickel insertion protein n=1 Tax=Paenibacillus alkalitolerans TaxID=2799335 RepID=UPI002D800ED9|nr:nickel insertion protein [Paenibacillus alkalitolerans]